MKVFFSNAHREHAPLFALGAEGRVPIPDLPERVNRILQSLRRHQVVSVASSLSEVLPALERVHTRNYLDYLASAYVRWQQVGEPAAGVLPDVFPTRSPAGPSRSAAGRAGWYAFDLLAPIVGGTFPAAAAAAGVALAGAQHLLQGGDAAYALCRPPGHHAGPDFCGGYCYLNHAAVAVAELLAAAPACGRIAILDLDAHHGNGTQAIFYHSAAVLYVSLHADPHDDYPYYWGHADECGSGSGAGTNLNLPLPLETADLPYLTALETALARIRAFVPGFLVVSLGVDGLIEDPIGSLCLSRDLFPELGRRVHDLECRTLVVQEGGYELEQIGPTVAAFLDGLAGG